GRHGARHPGRRGRGTLCRAASGRPSESCSGQAVKLVWSRFALSDRNRIFDHIEAQSPKAAAAVDERIVASTRRLTAFPESGRPGRVAGTRELVVQRTPFVIAYRLTEGSVFVLAVLHGAQLWPDEFQTE